MPGALRGSADKGMTEAVMDFPVKKGGTLSWIVGNCVRINERAAVPKIFE